MLLIALLVISIVCWTAGAWYILEVHPEVPLFKQMLLRKRSWAEKLTSQYGTKSVIIGGSSSAFAFDTKRMLNEYGLPVVNCGLQAGLGPKVLTQSGLDMLNEGDTLLIALESTLLIKPFRPTGFGIQFSIAMHHPEWVTREDLGVERVPMSSALIALRPGAYRLITAVGKRLQGLPAYRYSIADVDEAGFLQPSVRMPFDGPPLTGGKLHKEARLYFSALRDECARRHIRAAYVLPWAYCPPEWKKRFQAENLQLIREISEFFPVIRDEYLGAYEVRAHFADSGFHLIGEGSRKRTDQLAYALLNWDLWTPEELASKDRVPPGTQKY